MNVPIIKIGFYSPETTKISRNVLEEKKDALWWPSLDFDNSVRLGPNKNNIIEESLRSERAQKKDCKQ